MKKRFHLILIGGIMVCFGIGIAFPVFGYEIQKLANVPVENDFTLGPGKIEVFLGAGEEETRNLMITSRLGGPMNFKIEIEDFVGSPTGEQAAILLGQERGPYSLRDYLQPELTEFTLAHGERMVLPVKISIPEDAEPGGLYGSVLISTSPFEEISKTEEEAAQGQMRFIARIGSLFFVRVKGEAEEEGMLEKFDTTDSKRFYQQGPISFSVSYRNTGSVHLTPYGLIEITNLLGKKVGEIEIDPYFAMPQSLRYREMKWEKELGLGIYTATLHLNRGYEDIIDTAKIYFLILPWKIVLIGLLILVALILFFRWIATSFEIRRKTNSAS
jgi:hypothetical protein